jgi:hypothetical protein
LFAIGISRYLSQKLLFHSYSCIDPKKYEIPFVVSSLECHFDDVCTTSLPTVKETMTQLFILWCKTMGPTKYTTKLRTILLKYFSYQFESPNEDLRGFENESPFKKKKFDLIDPEVPRLALQLKENITLKELILTLEMMDWNNTNETQFFSEKVSEIKYLLEKEPDLSTTILKVLLVHVTQNNTDLMGKRLLSMKISASICDYLRDDDLCTLVCILIDCLLDSILLIHNCAAEQLRTIRYFNSNCLQLPYSILEF